MTAPAPKSSSKAERFAFRLSPHDKRLLERAAALRSTSLAHFVLESSLQAAQRELAERTQFVLPPDKMKAFCDALDADPREIPALRALLERPDPFGS